MSILTFQNDLYFINLLEYLHATYEISYTNNNNNFYFIQNTPSYFILRMNKMKKNIKIKDIISTLDLESYIKLFSTEYRCGI